MHLQDMKGLDTRQAAEYLKGHGIPVTPGTLEVWRSHGKGPRYRKVARWVIYTPPDLDKFAYGRVVETTDSFIKSERK